MKVLLLSPYPERLQPSIEAASDHLLARYDAIEMSWVQQMNFDWIVSYGYSHIIRRPVLDAFPSRIVNLHISYLPWNRGADPNLWSWIDDTPKGVTLHQVDEGVDTGPIIDQVLVHFGIGETLATSYEQLRTAAETMFTRVWPLVRAGRIHPRRQPAGGSVHRARDRDAIMAVLPAGWDTPVNEVARLGRRIGRHQGGPP